VLLLGEPGSGRGALARHLHERGPAPTSPFVELDCAGLESLHFVENAGGGTIFLREIENLAPRLQGALEHLLRLGAAQSRVVASAEPDLPARCDRGLFSKRLFDAFGESCLQLPPLRDRRLDVPDLVARFLAARRSSLRVGEGVMDHLVEYDWPGNVVELEQVVERLCARASAAAASPDDLPPQIRWFAGNGTNARRFDQGAEEFQLRLIADALRRTHRR
jgi:DNA-binding NtrC family response regulator